MPESHFFIKSDRLSPKPEEGQDKDAEPCFWSSKACSPALRFFALFLLLALADDLTGSAATCGLPRPAILLCCVVLLAREMRWGPCTLTLVFPKQLPHVTTFDMPPGMARVCADGAEAGEEVCRAQARLLLLLFPLGRRAFSDAMVRVAPWPGTMMCPQALQTCCRWAAEMGMSFSTSNSVRRRMRKADVSGADCESRWAASLRKCTWGDSSEKCIFKWSLDE